MSVQGSQTIVPGIAPSAAETGRRRYLFSPVVDFLCLGGASLFFAPLMFMLPQTDAAQAAFLSVTIAIAHLVNHPHFAFSYQIFYERFREKAFGTGYATALRARYIVAGIVVPAGLVLFLLAGLLWEDASLLGYGGNLMGLLVGWHYVKQGYGMLMVDAALKRQYFEAEEKRVLLANSYAVWLLTWLSGNAIAQGRTIWGIEFYTIPVPELVLAVSFCAAFTTTGMMIGMLIKKRRANGGSLPFNGVVAYTVTLYTWLLLVRTNALWMMIVPALHSLQYLVVVARYKINRKLDDPAALEPVTRKPLDSFLKHRYQIGLAGFVLAGILLGYMGFWGGPKLLQATVSYNQAILGPTVFLFLFWIFINVHHYFLDNVMWRSENPDVRKHLFG